MNRACAAKAGLIPSALCVGWNPRLRPPAELSFFAQPVKACRFRNGFWGMNVPAPFEKENDGKGAAAFCREFNGIVSCAGPGEALSQTRFDVGQYSVCEKAVEHSADACAARSGMLFSKVLVARTMAME